MINIPVADFIIVLLIFMRIIAAFVSSPIFGHKAIPALVKVFLSLVISYIVFLTIDKTKIEVEFSLGWIFVNAMKEIMTGLIIGFTLNFIFHGISYAGMLIGFDMGLSMASELNPIDGSGGNVIGDLISLSSILIFFLINGHHYIISSLVYSFAIIRIGKLTINQPVFDLIVKYSGAVFIIAVKVSSPVLVSFILIQVAEGIMAKVIPQMQIFFVAQPLLIGIGLFMLASLVPVYIYVIKYLLKGYEDNLVTLIRAMGQ